MKKLPMLAPLVFAMSLAHAADQPLWELGAGIGLLSIPDYRGAAQRHNYALPIPYVVYRGDVLKIDRDKVRGLFYKGERSEWDISMGASVPVRSRDNTARAGMPDLDPTVEIGPQWSYKLRSDWLVVTLRLPLRKVLALDFPHLHDAGAVFTPTLALDLDDQPLPGWHASMSTGPIFGDRRYFDYYYGVSAAQAIAGRPAWQATSGYGGWQLTGTLTRRFRDFWIGGFLRGDYLDGAVFEDSPLLKKKMSVMGGIGVSWVFLESGARVENAR
jgi:outer membrane scaffolding protein for murein synthesis (MipA/OmpV family)